MTDTTDNDHCQTEGCGVTVPPGEALCERCGLKLQVKGLTRKLNVIRRVNDELKGTRNIPGVRADLSPYAFLSGHLDQLDKVINAPNRCQGCDDGRPVESQV